MTVPISTLLLVMVTTSVVVLVSLGFLRSAGRAGLTSPTSFAIRIALGMSLWLAVTAGLALVNFFKVNDAGLPREPLLLPIALVTMILLGATQTFRRVASAIPTWQPVALLTFRMGVELAFWNLHREGMAPIQVTFEGKNIDVLVGLTAPIIAAGLTFGWIGPRALIVWNVLGLASVGNAIFIAATSAPGPQHSNWSGEAFIAIADWPVVWIPAFLAPVGIFAHIVSLRQAKSMLARQHPDSQ